MLGTWRGIGIFAAACVVVGLGFGSLFVGPGPKVLQLDRSDEALERAPCDFSDDVDGVACQGTGALMSVLTPGVSECSVRVGGKVIGPVPLFKRPAPTGRCSIVVECADGHRYCEAAMLRGSLHRRLTVEADQWSEAPR
ncbi:MAG: hypothetical protein AAF658_07985 [Myxococcota bacterium]